MVALSMTTERVRCLVRSEVGSSATDYEPYTVSRTGDHGIAGLHEPNGKLATFYAAGYTDPYDPGQAVKFLEEQLEAGQGWAWVAARENPGGWC